MPRRFVRHTRLIGLLTAPALLALGLVGAPSVFAGDPCYHDFAIPPTTTGTDTEIKLMPCAFSPTVSRIATGTTVVFRNGPDFTHLVTGANQDWGSRDVEVKPGQTVSYRFDSPGVYPYACALHRGMSGAIVVGDTAAVLSAGATSDDSTATSEGAGSGVDGPVLVALGTSAGIITGAAAVWLALRRRGRIEQALVPRS
jgi:plastocyanin